MIVHHVLANFRFAVEDGLTSAQYALILALVTLAAITIITLVGSDASAVLN